MNTNKNLLIFLLIIALIGGFLFYQHDKNTTTIDLPGDNKIEITE